MSIDSSLEPNFAASGPVRTTCPYCGVGCGVIARKTAGGAIETIGDPDHPANFGRLCSKGSALDQTLQLDGRLLHPEIHGQRVGWDAALDHIAGRFAAIRREHGPEAIAFYLSGQLLTEDYYVANKLAKGFIGTAHVDTNSRLCMASSVAGHKRAFGSDTVPNTYKDLELADLVVLAGSNAAWCHPVIFQRLLAARRARGSTIVAIDVRHTATTKDADLALILKPGTDAFLFNGLLVYLADHGALDRAFIDAHTEGVADALAAARAASPDMEMVAQSTGLNVEDIARFYAVFAATPKTVTCYSQGIHQSSSGSDKVNAILNCHLATGRIGRPGSGPFSLTGQPNAKGGREVGGLANQLAAHMDFTPDAIDRVGRFWGAPAMAQSEGLKAVGMFEALREGRIKAIWILCTNPAVSLPEIRNVREALAEAELVIVSEAVRDTDTAQFAHVLLPTTTWGEKDGTVTNSERRISRQRPFMAAPGEARADWWQLAEIGRRMGWANAFSYGSAADVFAEHAALSAFENNGSRDFDLTGLAGLDQAQFDALEPVQWPVRTADGEGAGQGTERLFADGGFFRPNGRARLLPITPRLPQGAVSAEYPFMLNTGRVRDHWHTLTRTGKAASLSRHRPEPTVDINPADADRLDITDDGFAVVLTSRGEMVLRARVTADQPAGQVFIPMHWSRANGSAGAVGQLIPGITDPISGQPESKAIPASVHPARFAASGLVLSRTPLELRGVSYWARYLSEHSYIHSFGHAPAVPLGFWAEWTLALFAGRGEVVRYEDEAAGIFRAGIFDGDALVGAVLLAPGEGHLEAGALEALFARDALAEDERAAALSLQSAEGLISRGAIVCACYSVGANQIRDLIASGQATCTDTVGQALKAGTNCGSCLPEIRDMLGAAEQRVAAE